MKMLLWFDKMGELPKDVPFSSAVVRAVAFVRCCLALSLNLMSKKEEHGEEKVTTLVFSQKEKKMGRKEKLQYTRNLGLKELKSTCAIGNLKRRLMSQGFHGESFSGINFQIIKTHI